MRLYVIDSSGEQGKDYSVPELSEWAWSVIENTFRTEEKPITINILDE